MDEKEGYGDDFDFDKHYMINTIMPEHLQVLDLDMNPAQYRSFDFEKTSYLLFMHNEIGFGIWIFQLSWQNSRTISLFKVFL